MGTPDIPKLKTGAGPRQPGDLGSPLRWEKKAACAVMQQIPCIHAHIASCTRQDMSLTLSDSLTYSGHVHCLIFQNYFDKGNYFHCIQHITTRLHIKKISVGMSLQYGRFHIVNEMFGSKPIMSNKNNY